MAKSNKIKNTDLFDGDVFAKTQERAERFLTTIIDIKTGLKSMLGDSKSTIAGNPLGSSKDIDALNKSLAENEALRGQLLKLQLEENIARNNLKKLSDQEIAVNSIKAKQRKESIDGIKNETIANNANSGTLEKLTAKNALLRAERAKVNTTTKEGQIRLQEINKELDKNNASISANSDRLKRQSMNVGNYTSSVKEAIESTGIFGEAVGKFSAIQAAFNAVLELGTIGRKKDVVAEEAQTLASEEHTVALEEEAIATEELSLGRRILNAITNPYALIIVAGAAALKILYDNVRATQEQKDTWEASEEAAKTAAKNVTVIGINSAEAAKKTYQMVIAEKTLQDIEIKKVAILEDLNNQAQIARTTAGEDNKTTQQKIALLQVFIDKTNEAAKIKIEAELEKSAVIKLGLNSVNELEAYGIKLTEKGLEIDAKKAASMVTYENLKKNFKRNATREEFKAASESIGNIIKLNAEKESAERRVIKQQAALLDQDTKERLALKREEFKNENSLISIEEQKQQANEDTRYEQEKADTLKKQKDLGNEKIGQQEQFNKELNAIEQAHIDNQNKITLNATIKGIEQTEKTNREINEVRINNLGFMEIAKRRKIEDRITKDKISAIKLRLVEELDLHKGDDLKKEALQADAAAQIKKIEDDEAKIKRDRAINTAHDIAAITSKVQDLQNQKTEDALNRDLHIRETNIEQQSRLAERGLKNQLAFEKEKLAQTQLAQAKQREKEVRQAKVMAYLSAVLEFAKQDPNSAPFKALAMVSIAEAISGAFKDGVEGFKGKGTDTSDSNLVLLSNNESVITASGTRKHSGLATAMNEDKVSEWFAENGSRLGVGFEISKQSSGSESYAHVIELRALGNKLDRLELAIQNKKESVTYWDGHGNMIHNTVENGMRTVLTHIKSKPRI